MISRSLPPPPPPPPPSPNNSGTCPAAKERLEIRESRPSFSKSPQSIEHNRWSRARKQWPSPARRALMRRNPTELAAAKHNGWRATKSAGRLEFTIQFAVADARLLVTNCSSNWTALARRSLSL